MSDLTARARELAGCVLRDCARIVADDTTDPAFYKDYAAATKLIAEALRAERKRAKAEAFEAAERVCREVARAMSGYGDYAGLTAIECADRIAGLERDE